MQVFHPLPDPIKSAKCIDDKRLLNQVNEIKVILNVLHLLKTTDGTEKIPWSHHPNVLLWEHDVIYLRAYQLKLLDEWLERHYRTSLKIDWTWTLGDPLLKPSFFTPEYFKQQQEILIKKNPEHYQKVFGESQ